MSERDEKSEIDGLMERLHELDWGEWPAVGEAAAALEKAEATSVSFAEALVERDQHLAAAQARVVQLEAALRDARLQIEYLHGKVSGDRFRQHRVSAHRRRPLPYGGPRRREGSMSEWQPIETAPKDGSFIWVSDGLSMRIGFWAQERWADMALAENRHGRRDVMFTPTHWMPLPTPPQGGSHD